jgi:hypothetical protein
VALDRSPYQPVLLPLPSPPRKAGDRVYFVRIPEHSKRDEEGDFARIWMFMMFMLLPKTTTGSKAGRVASCFDLHTIGQCCLCCRHVKKSKTDTTLRRFIRGQDVQDVWTFGQSVLRSKVPRSGAFAAAIRKSCELNEELGAASGCLRCLCFCPKYYGILDQ